MARPSIVGDFVRLRLTARRLRRLAKIGLACAGFRCGITRGLGSWRFYAAD
jgi:hypothetical protein